jgi:hypothetical protein
MTENNYHSKIDVINKQMKHIQKRRTKHYKKYGKLKKISDRVTALINAFNAVSVCSIIITLTPVFPAAAIIAITTASISGISTAIMTSYNLNVKIENHHTAYLEYATLYRDIQAKIKKNNLSSKDLDLLLEEINDKLSLIENSAPPIKI